jgi:hypothetical protein
MKENEDQSFTNQLLGDSMYFEKNSKGYNYGATVRLCGSGDVKDNAQAMQDRLLDYQRFLEKNFPNG